MSIYNQLSEVLSPHANSLNKTIATSAMLIHSKIDAIEKHAATALKPDVGDEWFRVNIKKKFAGAETEELGEVPQNQIWKVQAICVDGITEKSPAFIITAAGGVLVFSVIKEGVGTETVGGDIVLLKGEPLSITTRASGIVSATIHLVRRRIPVIPNEDTTGEPGGALEPINVHEVGRDIIMSKDGQWKETTPETLEVGT